MPFDAQITYHAAHTSIIYFIEQTVQSVPLVCSL